MEYEAVYQVLIDTTDKIPKHGVDNRTEYFSAKNVSSAQKIASDIADKILEENTALAVTLISLLKVKKVDFKQFTRYKPEFA